MTRLASFEISCSPPEPVHAELLGSCFVGGKIRCVGGGHESVSYGYPVIRMP